MCYFLSVCWILHTFSNRVETDCTSRPRETYRHLMDSFRSKYISLTLTPSHMICMNLLDWGKPHKKPSHKTASCLTWSLSGFPLTHLPCHSLGFNVSERGSVLCVSMYSTAAEEKSGPADAQLLPTGRLDCSGKIWDQRQINRKSRGPKIQTRKKKKKNSAY